MLALFLVLATAAASAAPIVELVALDGTTHAIGIAELERLQAEEITVPDPHTKAPARYRVVPLTRVLGIVGIAFENPLRGPHLVAKLHIEAADAYRVAFSLPELDPRTGATEAYLGFALDGQPLDAEVGPFRLVVPTDKRGARWVRQVTRIVLVP